MLVAHGDQGGGYLLAIDTDDRGEPVAWFGVNAYGVLHRSHRSGWPWGSPSCWSSCRSDPHFRLDVLLTDGRAATTLTDLPQLVGMAPFTGISVGADRADRSTGRCIDGRAATRSPGSCTPSATRPDRLSADAPAERARVWAEGAKIYD